MTSPHSRSIAHSEALLYADQAEDAARTIRNLHRRANTPNRAGLLAEANGRLGLAVKLAEVHAILAVAEAIAAGGAE